MENSKFKKGFIFFIEILLVAVYFASFPIRSHIVRDDYKHVNSEIKPTFDGSSDIIVWTEDCFYITNGKAQIMIWDMQGNYLGCIQTPFVSREAEMYSYKNLLFVRESGGYNDIGDIIIYERDQLKYYMRRHGNYIEVSESGNILMDEKIGADTTVYGYINDELCFDEDTFNWGDDGFITDQGTIFYLKGLFIKHKLIKVEGEKEDIIAY